MVEVVQPSLLKADVARAWLKLVRPVHWIKNLLLIAPALFAHTPLTLELAGRLALGMVLVSLAASAGYMVNDVLDQTSDRLSGTKRFKPIAQGLIRARDGTLGALVLGSAALCLGFGILGPAFGALLVTYLIATLFYSRLGKHVPAIDVLMLAGLHVLRIAAGGLLADVALSFWLLAFAFALFVSLAFAKRLDELTSSSCASSMRLPGRAYRPRDRARVLPAMVISASAAAFILVAYITFSATAEESYRHSSWLWLSASLLAVWLVHILRQARVGGLGGDPVVFAASDWKSLCLAALAAASLILAV